MSDVDLSEQLRNQIIGSLGPIEDTARFITNLVRESLRLSQDLVLPISQDFQYSQPSVQLLVRCVARRSQDTLSAVIDLMEGGHCYQALTLLRPMCEELIFIRFIRSLPTNHAVEYIGLKSMLEVDRGILAQRRFFNGMVKITDDRAKTVIRLSEESNAAIEKRISHLKIRLKAVGSSAGWGNRDRPDVKYMAEQTDSRREYDFFYSASSSACHASLHDLLRMVWGDPESTRFSASDDIAAQHYRYFAVFYGFWLFHSLVQEVVEEFPGVWADHEEQVFNDLFDILIAIGARAGYPPIVTDRELQWTRGALLVPEADPSCG